MWYLMTWQKHLEHQEKIWQLTSPLFSMSSTFARLRQVLIEACVADMSRNVTAPSCKGRRFVRSLIKWYNRANGLLLLRLRDLCLYRLVAYHKHNSTQKLLRWFISYIFVTYVSTKWLIIAMTDPRIDNPKPTYVRISNSFLSVWDC